VSNFTEGMLPLHELISDYNIFWPQLFWIRWQWPEVATWAIENALVDTNTVLGRLALSAWQSETIDPVWIDCFNAMWLDNVVAIAVIILVAYVSSRLLVILIQTLIRLAILMCYTYQTLSLISETVEIYNLQE
tara:strand:+ start:114 stop:512 length:399 start_codon:yes stop_codon:yes gene_type:complete